MDTRYPAGRATRNAEIMGNKSRTITSRSTAVHFSEALANFGRLNPPWVVDEESFFHVLQNDRRGKYIEYMTIRCITTRLERDVDILTGLVCDGEYAGEDGDTVAMPLLLAFTQQWVKLHSPNRIGGVC